MQTHPEAWRLYMVEWQVFGTLTFLNERGSLLVPLRWFSEGFRKSRFVALMRNHFRWCKARYSIPDGMDLGYLPWVLRVEEGEQTGRLHLHFLLCGYPPESITPSFLFRLSHQWGRMGGGFARCRAFGRGQGTTDYILKIQEFGQVSRALASDLYESNKFALRSCDLWLNDACLRVAKARARRVQAGDYPAPRTTPLTVSEELAIQA